MRSFISLTIAVVIFSALAYLYAGEIRVRAGAASFAQGEQDKDDGVRRITVEELRAALEKGTAIVIDVRGEDQYKEGHIKGARWIPADRMASHAKELPKDKLIVLYCS